MCFRSICLRLFQQLMYPSATNPTREVREPQLLLKNLHTLQLLIPGKGCGYLSTYSVTSFLEIPFYCQHGKNFSFLLSYSLSKILSSHFFFFSNYHAENSVQTQNYTEISLFRYLNFSQTKSPRLNLLKLCVVESSSDLWDVWKQQS